jgi:hypothetical protein
MGVTHPIRNNRHVLVARGGTRERSRLHPAGEVCKVNDTVEGTSVNDLTTEEMISVYADPLVWAKTVGVMNSMFTLRRFMFMDDDEVLGPLNALEGLGDAAASWDMAAACAAFVNAINAARESKGQGDVG